MAAQDTYLMAIISAPADIAGKLAGELVSRKLAACAQVTGKVESFYWWEGTMHREPEVLIYLKTKAALVPGIRELLKEHHPYEVPEFITLPILGGNPAYLSWLAETLS